jgi:hypothetical protein
MNDQREISFDKAYKNYILLGELWMVNYLQGKLRPIFKDIIPKIA